MNVTRDTVKLAQNGDDTALRAVYLDYVNHFLTVTGFAVYYGLSVDSAHDLIVTGRNAHEAFCAK